MSNELRNQRLKQVSDALLSTIKGVGDGSVDREDARTITGLANAATAVEAQDLKGRLAAGKLAAIEAKLIDATAKETKAIAANS
jgi:hypothetical protein